jgi:hypothetical protein
MTAQAILLLLEHTTNTNIHPEFEILQPMIFKIISFGYDLHCRKHVKLLFSSCSYLPRTFVKVFGSNPRTRVYTPGEGWRGTCF